MFDMTQCKVGDKLVTGGGQMASVVSVDNGTNFPYNICYDGGMDTVTINGKVRQSPNINSHNDIVGFWEESLPEQPSQDIPTISLHAETRYYITLAGNEVEVTYEELCSLQVQINDIIGEA